MIDANQQMLEEIFKIYIPPPPAKPIEYRAYYNTNEIICFSTEDLQYPYLVIEKSVFDSNRPDLYKIVDGHIVQRTTYYQNKLQLVPNGSKFASVKNNMQWAVDKDWPGEKAYWDPIND